MKLVKRLLVVLLVVCMMTGVLTIVAACNKDCGIGNHTDEGHDGVCDVCGKPTVFKHVDANGDKKCDTCGKDITYTMNDYVSTTPSNWNELSSTDANDDAIMGYIGSSFFSYDFKFDGNKRKADGTINAAGIVDGAFEVTYDAATALEDVTTQYAQQWGILDKKTGQPVTENYIWKITLRQDLKWDDGTPIKAEDFVYTMEQQLDPNFQLERASEYYNNAVKIHNAKNYLYQGQGASVETFESLEYSFADIVDGLYQGEGDYQGLTVYIDVENAWGIVVSDAQTPIEGAVGNWVPITDETLIRDPAVEEGEDEDYVSAKYLYETYYGPGCPGESSGPEVVGIVTGQYPDELSFDQVGIFADGDYGIVVVCDSPMKLKKDDGSLSYLAAYNFSGLPLVKRSLYEECKQQPQTGSTLWTTTYNTSLATSASWGPFKLTYFQAGRQFELSRNDNWYGYSLEENKGLYPVDKIVTQVIETEAASQMAFWKGEVDSLGISVTIADDYKNSPYAIFSPRIATFGIQLLGNLEALKNSGRNNGILAIKEFREALSLSLDRDEYNRQLSTANQTCLGLLGEDYYYDVENGGVYRFTDQGKAALLRTYGFTQNSEGKWVDTAANRVYNTIDEAVDAMTGVNMTLAKQLVNEAYTELTTHAADYGYDASKKIQIQYGESEPSESADRTLKFLNDWVSNLVSGTQLEGKIEVVMRTDLGKAWAEKFQQGEYEISTGGIGNAPFDPFYLISGHLGNLPEGKSVSFHQYWDVSKESLTITIPSVGDSTYPQKGEEVTMTLDKWYRCLNGNADAQYNWGAGFAPTEVRLEILARLEEYILGQYYTLPTSRGMTSALGSAKWSYITKTYNTMMGFGGMKYMTFNYADDEWAAFVQMYGGDLSDFYKG